MDPIRVLIVEDDADIIDLLRSVLEPTYECIVATNGLEGLQVAQAGEPDMIVCDIMMPVMDGREFVRGLRANPGFENIPVIFLSALSSREQIREGYSLGASLYMTKPIEPQRFRRNIELFITDHNISAKSRRRSVSEIQTGGIGPQAEAESDYYSEVQRLLSSVQPPLEVPPKAPVLNDAPPVAVAAPPQAPAPRRMDPDLERALRGDRKGKSANRLRLLVVDDDKDTLMMIRSGFDDVYDVLTTGDGISAIQLAVRYQPDIFIIDGMLPRMTGYQLTMMLKKNRDFYKAPIIFISGKATARDKLYVERLGVSNFLAKPFKIEQLQPIIQEIVDKPNFALRADRIDFKQFFLEQFQHIETHRSAATGSTDSAEKRYAEKSIKNQLH